MKPTIKNTLFVCSTVALMLTSACGSSSPEKTATPPAVDSSTTTPSPDQRATPTSPTPAPEKKKTVQHTDKYKTLIEETMKYAKKGRIKYCDFAARLNLIDDVEKEWGKPDTNDSAGKGMYATYNKRQIAFGYNKGSLIFDVRSWDQELQQLTLDDIQDVLGKPAATRTNNDDQIYIYNAGKIFELKFIIPKSTGKVDHISVFSPQDAKNLMLD